LGVMSVIAIVGLLVNSRFDTNEILSSIINLTQVAIPVLVLVFMKSLKNDLKSYYDIGKDALKRLQKENETFLEGPRPHSIKSSNSDQSKDEEESEADAGIEYLFIRHHDPKNRYRSKLIDLADLDNGVLSISVQKNTLVWGLGFTGGRENPLQTEIKDLQNRVYEKVKAVVEKNLRSDLCKIEDKARYKSDVAIRIDFDEERMKKSKFAEIVYACAKVAVDTIREYPNPKNDA